MKMPVLVASGLIACCTRVFAQEGYPDATFGTNGVNVTTYAGAAAASATAANAATGRSGR